MKIAITARHFELTPVLKDFVQEKLTKLDHHLKDIIEGEVILTREGGFQIAEGKLHFRHSLIVAKGKSNDMYLAVSDMVSKLLKQLKTQENKWKAKKRASKEVTAKWQ
jgi:ribosomal subunit interface protein|uniref:Ribosome-associated translation inhibitor RaiA n=1 Tax=candidate division WOR-3 bacterium TaxID=2052148 RepID=A0A7C6ED09_UNCW3